MTDAGTMTNTNEPKIVSAVDAETREGRRVERDVGASATAPLATSTADTCPTTWGANHRCCLAPGHDGPHMPSP